MITDSGPLIRLDGRQMLAMSAVPALDLSDDQALVDAMFATPAIFYHACRTARMGQAGSPGSVVDWSGRVHGVAGLRVVDASILPDIVSVAINPTVMMVAERIAAMIVEEG